MPLVFTPGHHRQSCRKRRKKLMTKFVVVAFAALSILATAIPAKAGNCTTNCQRTYNGGSTCNTYCY
jgi:hypothetical protein